MAKSNCTQTASINQAEIIYEPEISGMMNLESVHQMIFCISQSEDSASELDAYTLLGLSNILDESIRAIKADYIRLDNKLKAIGKRHRKIRSALAFYVESGGFVDMSAIAKILADDEKEVSDAN